MLDLQKIPTPDWIWLPENTIASEVYTWTLFRLEEERYWQAAWSEYKKRRNFAQKSYRSKPEDIEQWQQIGQKLFANMMDPYLFIEQLFVHFNKMDKPRPPEVSEVNLHIDTIGLWFDDQYRPDAEGDLFIAGNKLNNLMLRYPGTNRSYWLEKGEKEYPPYFQLLFRATGELPKSILVKAHKQIVMLPVLRSLERFSIWPDDAHKRLMVARAATIKENHAGQFKN